MAERNPLVHRSPLAAPLVTVTRYVLRSPYVVLIVAALLAVLSILVTAQGLTFKTSRLDLLNPRSEYNQRWLAFLEEFGRRDDAVIVVRAADRAVLTRAIDDLAARLGEQPELFESIFFRRDLSPLKSKALYYLPEAELARIEQLVRQGTAIVPQDGRSADPAAALAQLNERMEHIGAAGPEARAAVEQEYLRVAGMMLAGLAPSTTPTPSGGLHLPLADAGHPFADVGLLPLAGLEQGLAHFEPQYLLADEGRMGFVLLKLNVEEAEMARDSRAIGQLRTTIAAARTRHPGAWIGLTGMPVIEFDEMQASQTDMMWTSIISLLGVFCLFIACYGGLRHSLLANVVLLLATAYSFCFVTLVVGHLNILSAALGAVLIGLGIDFGIHYLARYLKLRGQGYDEEGALLRTSIEVGPGIFTGGVTTAAAFFMAGMTDFLGIRELGLVAGGSLLLCLAATMVVLPPLVLVVDRRWPIGAVPSILPAGGWFRFTSRWPRLVMGACLVLTLVAAAGAGWLRYDHNLLNLQPRHLESADIERQLFSNLEDSVWFAVSLCESREELLARKARFEQLDSVAKTEEIASLLPVASPRRRQLVASIHKRLAALPPRLPEPPPINPQRLRQEIARAQALLAQETPYETPAGTLLAQLRGLLAQMPPEIAAQRLSQSQAVLAGQSLAQLSALRAISNPQEPQLVDLPQELVDRFVGVRGTFLLKVYARGNVWDMDKLAAFVRDVESIDPQVTGHPVQTCYASQHMQQSYIFTGLYALVAVIVFLWIDLRSLAHSLLAMTPVALGFVQMCGLFGWLDIPFNPANMIVLPVILGIGVDHGVHLVHAWRQQRGRFVLGDSTAVAVLLTATTTTASFGVLILARHQGLQSLGQVLTIGVTTCLFSSIVFFPAMLAWLTRNRVEQLAAQAAAVGREEVRQTEPATVEMAAPPPPEVPPPVAVVPEPPALPAEPPVVAAEHEDQTRAEQPLDEQQIIEQVENEVAALVLEASAHAHAKPEPAPSPPPIVPRRRPEPASADENPPADDSAEPGGRGAGLRHLAGPRQSDR